MRAKNTTAGPLEVDGGRTVAAGEFGDVNSRDELVARHLDAGRLVRPPSRRSRPVATDAAAEEPANTTADEPADDMAGDHHEPAEQE